MLQTAYRSMLALVPFIVGLAWTPVESPAQSVQRQLVTARGEWRAYHGDLRNHHYSPLDQISAENFNQLEVAWRSRLTVWARGRSTSWRAHRWW